MFAVENVFVVFWRMGKPWVGPILSEPIFKIILSLSALNYILSLKKENPLEITFSKASKIVYMNVIKQKKSLK